MKRKELIKVNSGLENIIFSLKRFRISLRKGIWNIFIYWEGEREVYL